MAKQPRPRMPWLARVNDQARPGDDIEAEKFTFDRYNGHPTPNGQYHYHTVSAGPLEALQALGIVTKATPGSAEVEFYGMLCDGTAVLGCTELDGSTPSKADFDAQNGHIHDLKDKAGTVHLAGRYHTHICPGQLGGHAFTPEIQYYRSCTRGQ